MPLSPKARRAAAELDIAIADGNAQHVPGIVDSYDLSNGDRIAVVAELDRRARLPDADQATFAYSSFDQARIVS